MKTQFFAALALLSLLAFAGCNQPVAQADSEAGAAAAEPVIEGTQVSFEVSGMTCPHGCAKTVQETLAATDGVKKCDVNFDAKTATCIVDPDKFDSSVAIAKLAEAGFPITPAQPATN